MQIKIFTVPITDNGCALDELNKFLRSQKVLECIQQLVSNQNGASWCFCVKYIEGSIANVELTRQKKRDYKNELDEGIFAVFSSLREIRKVIAAEDKIPAYAICTDEELATMAKLPKINKSNLLTVKGFGEKKMEKFGVRIIEQWNEKNKNETSGELLLPDS